MSYDAIVLGAGIVGVSTALHLQKRGRRVVLVDRRGPGEETSYGNAGIIESSSLYPTAFPRDFATLFAVVTGREPSARFHWRALPGLASWLMAYWRASTPERLLDTAQQMAPILMSSVEEHRILAEEADAEHFFREGGWMKVFRSEAAFESNRATFALAHAYGLQARSLTMEEALRLEPFLQPTAFRYATLWSNPHTVSSPGGVTKAYARAFQKAGGEIILADARSLAHSGERWSVTGPNGTAAARDAVVALGPWAMDVLSPLGYSMPLAVKRGYHMHYASGPGARLGRPVLDDEGGYVLAPMEGGVRLTTGVEFAARDAPPTPVQVDMCEPAARRLYPLGERIEDTPWIGRRPMFPDSKPVIGAAPRHRGLWFAFGHQHLGFTLGPATGRLLAELMTGADAYVDPRPFSPERF